jgi:hypothetical protein
MKARVLGSRKWGFGSYPAHCGIALPAPSTGRFLKTPAAAGHSESIQTEYSFGLYAIGRGIRVAGCLNAMAAAGINQYTSPGMQGNGRRSNHQRIPAQGSLTAGSFASSMENYIKTCERFRQVHSTACV